MSETPDAAPSNRSLTAVEGLTVGHWGDPRAQTGCTVVLCPPEGCLASGRVLGGAPAVRETALLEPERMMPRIDAVCLAGGSAYGLAAAHGVMRWLEERGRGYPTGGGPVPIVPAACIIDFQPGRPWVRPGEREGYLAAEAASAAPVPLGAVGVALGASAGGYAGAAHKVPTGLGSAARTLSGATVAALAVSNPAGDVVDPKTGRVLAGHGWSSEAIVERYLDASGYRANTTLVVVATDALLSKAGAAALATAAHIGIARVTHPSHTPFDGDTTFALSTGRGPTVPIGALAVLTQLVVAEAIVAGVRSRPAGN